MRNRGFTLIELLIVISIVAILFAVALERLLRYQEMGERAAVEQNVAAISTALSMKFAAYVVRGRPAAIENEVGKNPIGLLARPPENYLGELFSPDIKTLPRGSWYFDVASHDLVYLPNRRRYLSAGEGPPNMLRFRVALTEVRNEPGEPRELPQPFVAANPPFKWVID
jgi:prepilin-type N-terminal cleavage/methylation domain-containing protein